MKSMNIKGEFKMSPVCWSWKNIRGSLRRIWQNLTWGWNETDVWSLDHTMAKWILPRLKYYRKIVHGYPSDFSRDNPDIKAVEWHEGEIDPGFEEWKLVLDRIIQTFEWVILDASDISDKYDKIDYHHFNLDFKFVDCEDGKGSKMELDGTPEEIVRHDELFKLYMEDCMVREEQIQLGLQLFARYYRNLWD